MNPLVAEAIGSIIRWALTIGAGELVHHQIWTASDAQRYVMAASIWVLALGWSLWQKRDAYRKILTALMLKRCSTFDDLMAHVRSGAPTPTVLTPPDTIPGVPAQEGQK